MSVARENFLDRVHTIQGALLENLLVDRALTDTLHNNRARLLRNGLMVVAFNSLEDFLRQRSAELLGFVSRTTLRFDDLPRALMLATTLEAMRAAHARAKLAMGRGDDPVPILQVAAAEVASTATGPLSLSRFAFGYAGSNVSADEVAGILGALHVADAWNELTALSSRVGLGAVPLRDAFSQGSRLRNAAAHQANANVQPTDLQAFCQQATAIALGFDLLASRAARLLHDSTSPYSQAPRARLAPQIEMVFVEDRAGRYSCRRERVVRALKRHNDREAAWNHAISIARPRFSPVVEQDRSGMPARWMTTDGP
jgi:hypothetical protein